MALNIDELIIKIEDSEKFLTLPEQELIIDALTLYKEMNY